MVRGENLDTDRWIPFFGDDGGRGRADVFLLLRGCGL